MDMATVQRDALAQVQSGAAVLDLNAGIPGFDEAAMLSAVVKSVHEVVDVPLCIDSSTPEALEAAVPLAQGKVADQLGHRRGALAGAAAAARREVRRGGDRHGQRRRGHLHGPAGAVGRRAQDRRACGRPWHPPRGRHHRPAHDADRRGRRRRDRHVRDDRLDPARARGERELRRLEHLVRHARPPGDRRRVPHDGRDGRHEHGDHEPATPRRSAAPCSRATCCSVATRSARRGSPSTGAKAPPRGELMPGRQAPGHVPAERDHGARARRHDAVQRRALGGHPDRVHVRRAAGRAANARCGSCRGMPSARSPTTVTSPTGSTRAGGFRASAR